jgi:ubiquinone/menaquinone biosynthesis C-methylase UbiE
MAHTSEKHHWDDFWAASQDLEDVYTTDDRITEFLSSRLPIEGMRVLEVGAGTGRDAARLAAMGADVWTLDYSDTSLRLMNEKLPEPMHIVCGDALSLPLASDAFDVVFHQGLLEHFRNPGALLAENFRVLKTGGHVLVDVPQRFHYYTLLKHILMFFDSWFAGWETEFSVRELEKLVADAGFEVVEMYGHNLYPPVWYRGMRRVFLKAGIRLPMYPLDGPAMRGLRSACRGVLPGELRLSTSMVIACLGRKR